MFCISNFINYQKRYFLVYNLIKKVIESKNNNNILKTKIRNSCIIPELLNYTINIYNGKQYVSLYINELLIGHKLGEFVVTRTSPIKRSNTLVKSLKKK